MAKNVYQHPEQLANYEALIGTISGVEKKGATMPYTSVNGNMFSFLDADGRLNLRLAEKERQEFIRKYKTTLSVQHDTVMKEYVLVPDRLLDNPKELQPFFKASFLYAGSLKPKGKK
jgi:hypothetical protein